MENFKEKELSMTPEDIRELYHAGYEVFIANLTCYNYMTSKERACSSLYALLLAIEALDRAHSLDEARNIISLMLAASIIYVEDDEEIKEAMNDLT